MRLSLVLCVVASLLPAYALHAAALTPEENEEFNKGERCKPLRDALEKAVKAMPREKGANPQERMATLMDSLKKPAKISEDDWSYCTDLFRRSLQEFRTRAIETEARTVIRAIELGVQTAFADGDLCPSAGPTPAKLDDVREGPVVIKESEWKSWGCSAFSMHGERQRFQYAMTTDAKAKTVEITARGFPSGPDAPVTFRAKGKAAGDTVTFGEIEREEAQAKPVKTAQTPASDDEELDDKPAKAGTTAKSGGGFGTPALVGAGAGGGAGGFCCGCLSGVCGCCVAQVSAQVLSLLAYTCLLSVASVSRSR